jgi:hypothetical protein
VAQVDLVLADLEAEPRDPQPRDRSGRDDHCEDRGAGDREPDRARRRDPPEPRSAVCCFWP